MADIVPLGVEYSAKGHEKVVQANRDIRQTGIEAEKTTETLRQAEERLNTAVLERTNTVTGITRANQEAAQSTKEWVASLNRQSQSFDQLRASIDPTFAASKRYEAALEQVDQALRAGIISQREANLVMDQAADAYLGAANGTRAMDGAGRAFDVRGVSMQLSQVAQSASATGMPLQALAIQLPDIGLAFGTIGIAAGVAAGALLPLIGNLFETGDGAKDAEEQLEDFSSALEGYQDYAERAMAKTEELRKEFGRFAEDVRRDAASMAEITASQAIAGLNASAFTEGLNGAMTAIERFRQREALAVDSPRAFGNAEFQDFKRQAEEAADSLGLTISQVEGLEAALQDVQSAESMTGVAEALNETIGLFDQMTTGISVLPASMAQFKGNLVEARDAAAAASTTMERMGNDAMGVSIGLSEAQRWARDTLVELREQGAEQQAINGYVAKGLSLTEARAAAERDAFAEQVRSRDVSADTADELMRAYDAANSVADAAGGIDLSWAAQQAADLAAQIERSVSATMALASQGRAALRQSEIRLENKGDPVATAGALARARLPDVSSLDPMLRDEMQAEQDAIVEMAEQEARNQQQFREWQESQRAAARSSRGGSGRRGGRGGKSEAEKLADKEQREGEREAERIRDDLTQATRDAMSITERYAAEVADLRELEEEGYLTTQEFARARAMLGEQMQAEQFEPMRQGIEDFSRAMSDAIVMGDSLRDNLAGVFQGIASDLVTSGIQNAIMQTFGGAQGGGGLFGGIFSAFGGSGVSNGAGGAISNALGGAIAGARADGGPVTGGRNYLVGERGPEIFQPGSSGHIVPNDQIGGGQGININFAPQIDARGADQQAVDRIEANMLRMEKELPNHIRKTLRQDGNQGRARKVMR